MRLGGKISVVPLREFIRTSHYKLHDEKLNGCEVYFRRIRLFVVY